MEDLFSAFADQFKPKEEPKPEVKPEPVNSPPVLLSDRWEAYMKEHGDISLADFKMIEQREQAVENLESMSEFEKKQRRLANKQKIISPSEVPHPDKIFPPSDEEIKQKEFEKTPNKELSAADKFLAGLTPPTIIPEASYASMPEGQKEAQEKNGIKDHGLGLFPGFESWLTKDEPVKEIEVEPLAEPKTKCYCGVDPGKKGGIVAINESGIIGKWVIPLIGDDIDAQGIWDILADLKMKYNITLVLEDVHSLFGMSASTNFSMGHTLGIILGIIVTSKIKLIRVAPKTWQKEIWVSSDMQYKPIADGKKKASVDTKLTSMKAAHRLFPNADFRATSRSKNYHDGITDAVCLAEYARIKNL